MGIELRFTYEYVKNYIEIESNSGCKLLSETYKNSITKLKLQCRCGKIFERNFSDFKNRKLYFCRDCGKHKLWDYNKIKNYIEVESKSGCKLLSKEYINANKKLNIKCECGNEFNTSFYNFKYKNKCKCNRCTKNEIVTFIELKKRYLNKGYIILSPPDDYKNVTSMIIIQDKEGYKYYFRAQNIVQGTIPDRFNIANPFTIENIHLWLNQNQKEFILLSHEYKGSNKNLQWKCLKEKCGEVFESCWHNIIGGSGCGYCAGKKVGISNCLATVKPDLLLQWDYDKNKNISPYKTYYNSTKSIWWKCKDNPDHVWEDSPFVRNVSVSYECPYCTHKRPSKEYNLKVCYPRITNEWDYEKNKNKPEDYLPRSSAYIYWDCQKCGHKWGSSISNRVAGNGCPECAPKSKGRDFVKNVFDYLNLKYELEFRFKDCRNIFPLPFDFYLNDYNICAEVDGQQHRRSFDLYGGEEGLRKTQFRDSIKEQYCIDNNIGLIRLKYKRITDIIKQLPHELYKYKIIDNPKEFKQTLLDIYKGVLILPETGKEDCN